MGVERRLDVSSVGFDAGGGGSFASLDCVGGFRYAIAGRRRPRRGTGPPGPSGTTISHSVDLSGDGACSERSSTGRFVSAILTPPMCRLVSVASVLITLARRVFYFDFFG